MQLSQIWEKVIGIKPIGVTDSFFDLGGHSLLAVRLFTEINEAFGTDLPLAAIFQSPTIEQIAALISGPRTRPPGGFARRDPAQGTKPPALLRARVRRRRVLLPRALRSSRTRPALLRPPVGRSRRQTTAPHDGSRRWRRITSGRSRRSSRRVPITSAADASAPMWRSRWRVQLQRTGDTIGLLAILDSYWMPQEAGEEQEGSRTHLKNLSERGFREKLDYIEEYAGYRLIKTKLSLTKIVSRCASRSGARFPAFMMDFYINVYIPEVNVKAEKDYAPAIYPGIITFFQATAEIERDPRQFWGKLTSEGIEVTWFPPLTRISSSNRMFETLAEKLADSAREGRAKGLTPW